MVMATLTDTPDCTYHHDTPVTRVYKWNVVGEQVLHGFVNGGGQLSNIAKLSLIIHLHPLLTIIQVSVLTE